MKEYIFNIDNQQDRTIVIPNAPTGLTRQNILAILNESTKRVLHSPFAQNVYGWTYGGTNLIITMSENAPSAVGSLMVKLYTDVDLATEASVKDGNDTVIAVSKAIQQAIGTAPSGSQMATVFAYIAAIYNSIVGSVSPDIPEGVAERLAMVLQFFGIYTEDDKVLVRVPDGQDYQIVPAEFMQDTEVTDELEDIIGTLDNDLTETVEYPEGSGTYMTKAQAITAQAMQIINPSES